MELVGGGSDINRATPSSFSVSVLLLALVERFGVSRMRDFFYLNTSVTSCSILTIFSYRSHLQNMSKTIHQCSGSQDHFHLRLIMFSYCWKEPIVGAHSKAEYLQKSRQYFCTCHSAPVKGPTYPACWLKIGSWVLYTNLGLNVSFI